MLRILVVFLLLANLAFYAWTRGWLTEITGVSPEGDRDPQRLQRQQHPERIRILPPGSVPSAPPPTSETSETSAVAAPVLACLEAGPYAGAELPQAEGVLKAALPADSWSVVQTERPGLWLVYMGKYANREAMAKKLAELKELRIAADELKGSPEHEPGLSLGRYDSRAHADESLAELAKRGVRSARVINLAPPATLHTLRIAQADAAVQR